MVSIFQISIGKIIKQTKKKLMTQYQREYEGIGIFIHFFMENNLTI